MFSLTVDSILFRSGVVKKNFSIPYLNVIIHVFMVLMSTVYERLIYNGVEKENH
ncbi:hypothetical protein J27TS8_34710 [Robertmurraya siralis]|uniref:Uncharacterized protein n=2 Tax=Robertmurraya TaxID=2837507 RepID=A0A919WK16_9BACI|nr:hypothetical protein J27TS8_34710 [Robertmurraya siralis]